MEILVAEHEYQSVVAFLEKYASNIQTGKIVVGKKEKWVTLTFDDSPKKRGPVQKISKEKIVELRRQNMSLQEIAVAVGCSRGYVQKVIRESVY